MRAVFAQTPAGRVGALLGSAGLSLILTHSYFSASTGFRDAARTAG
jgi:hypothetical protein